MQAIIYLTRSRVLLRLLYRLPYNNVRPRMYTRSNMNHDALSKDEAHTVVPETLRELLNQNKIEEA